MIAFLAHQQTDAIIAPARFGAEDTVPSGLLVLCCGQSSAMLDRPYHQLFSCDQCVRSPMCDIAPLRCRRTDQRAQRSFENDFKGSRTWSRGFESRHGLRPVRGCVRGLDRRKAPARDTAADLRVRLKRNRLGKLMFCWRGRSRPSSSSGVVPV